MKMNHEEIQNLLKDAVSSALGEEVPAATEKESDLTKQVKALSAQVSALTKAAATGFEKPKTTEDLVKEAVAPLMAQVEELKKSSGEEAPAKLPETAEELNEIIAKSVKEALAKSTDENEPSGKGKDDLAKMIENMSDEEAGELIKSLSDDSEGVEGTPVTKKNLSKSVELSEELEDANGNPLTKEQRASRAALDNFFGKTMEQSAARFTGMNESDED
jgi:hypothetical protein